MSNIEKINYVEFPSNNFEATKTFFKEVFAWEFVDYGEEYTAFTNAGLAGGFYKSELSSKVNTGAALVVFYSENLEASEVKIVKAGGEITVPTFSFPGGRRFHFSEPSGNEFAVWSDKTR